MKKLALVAAALACTAMLVTTSALVMSRLGLLAFTPFLASSVASVTR